MTYGTNLEEIVFYSVHITTYKRIFSVKQVVPNSHKGIFNIFGNLYEE